VVETAAVDIRLPATKDITMNRTIPNGAAILLATNPAYWP